MAQPMLVYMRTVLLLLIGSSIIAAQDRTNLRTILKNVERTYRSAAEYDLKCTTVFTRRNSAGKYMIQETLENRYSRRGSDGRESGQYTLDSFLVLVSGHTRFEYRGKQNAFTKADSWPGRDHDRPEEEFSDQTMINLLNFSEEDSPRLLRTETVMIDGKGVNCYVVRSTHDHTLHWDQWIDQERFVEVREVGVWDSGNARQTTTWHTINLNPKLADGLFVFKPPPGAKLVESFDR